MKHTFVHEGDGYDNYFEVLNRAKNALKCIHPDSADDRRLVNAAYAALTDIEGELGEAAMNKTQLGDFDFDVYTEYEFSPNNMANISEDYIAAAEFAKDAATELANALGYSVDLNAFDDLIYVLSGYCAPEDCESSGAEGIYSD